jgi:hypothetical protein
VNRLWKRCKRTNDRVVYYRPLRLPGRRLTPLELETDGSAQASPTTSIKQGVLLPRRRWYGKRSNVTNNRVVCDRPLLVPIPGSGRRLTPLELKTDGSAQASPVTNIKQGVLLPVFLRIRSHGQFLIDRGNQSYADFFPPVFTSEMPLRHPADALQKRGQRSGVLKNDEKREYTGK